MSTLTLKLLGPFVASYQGKPLRRFRTRAVQGLLIYLACQPEAHGREELMTLLWPEATQASAQNSLRLALYHLRQAVPEVTGRNEDQPVPFVLADRQAVQVNPAALFELDVAEFESRLEGTLEQRREAVGLYRGDFLADFYLPDSACYEVWVQTRRSDLRRQAVDALDKLVAYDMERGDYETAEGLARRQLAIDDLYDRGHRRLMEILVQQGRRSQALSHYDTYRRLLEEELGVEPDEASQQFIEGVKSDSLGPRPAAATAPRARPARKHNLQPQATRLIGRERELSELQTLAAAQENRLITIVGPGGMGKSRLALAFGQEQLNGIVETDGPKLTGGVNVVDGVFFVPLQPLRSRDEIVSTIAQELDLRFDGSDLRPPEQQLLDSLRAKRLLLILDNYEHLLAEATLLSEMLAVAPGLRLLVTSRQRLDLYGEQSFPLTGLDVPGETVISDAEELERYASAALFLERARRILPGFKPAAEEAHYLAELCRLVSGMPLALELAASWTGVLSPVEMVSQIRQNLDFLAVEVRDMPERHRSMRAVFDSTWSRLSAAEQAALAQLSVFRGDFSLEAAMAVAETDQRTIAGLVRKSVVQYDPENDRYRLHELLRQYSEGQLPAQVVVDDGAKPLDMAMAMSRHSAYYCRALADWELGLKSKRQLEVIRTIVRELDNVRAAWEWAVAKGLTELLGQATEGLAVFVDCRGQRHLGARLFGLATQALKEQLAASPAGTSELEQLYARLLARHAHFLSLREGHTKREELAQESLNILERSQSRGKDRRLEIAFSARILASIFYGAGRHEDALQTAKRSLQLSQEVDDDWGSALALAEMGRAAFIIGNWADGESWLESSLALQRKSGNKAGEAITLGLLANYVGQAGDLAMARRLQQASLAIHEAMGNQREAALVLRSLATCAWDEGRFRESELLCLDSIDRLRQFGFSWPILRTRLTLATTLEHLGRYDEVKSMAQANLTQDRDKYEPIFFRVSLRLLGTVATAQRRYDEATCRLDHYREMCAELGQPMADLMGSIWQSYVATELGAYPEAVKGLRENVQAGVDAQFIRAAFYGVPAGALLLARQGQVDRGLALYAAASRQPIVGNSRWFDDVVGAPLREMARTLPPRAVQEAEERGRAWDIWQAAEVLLEELKGRPETNGDG
jgi:DNA-binding SARP family transcriptional activator